MCKNSVKWLYRAEKNFPWDSGIAIDEDRIFYDESGKVRLIIETSGRITVTRGYSWNGCSPKVCFADLLFGTPDGVVSSKTGRPKTYFASMVHDALYQFLGPDSPLDERQADGCFLRLMEESDFFLSHPYWIAVRVFGRLVWRGKKAVRDWNGRIVPASGLLAPGRSFRPASSGGQP